MVVEHSFVTTVERGECFERTIRFLQSLGFRNQSGVSSELKFQRGLEKPKNFSRLEELPQSIALSFDRGRINLAASVTPFRKPVSQHQDYLVALAEAIQRQACELNGNELARVQAEGVSKLTLHSNSFMGVVKKRKTRQNIMIGFLLFAILLIIALILYAISNP